MAGNGEGGIEHFGIRSLATFASPYPCDMRDETDCWNYPQLRKFQACGMVNAGRVKVLAEQFDARWMMARSSRLPTTEIVGRGGQGAGQSGHSGQARVSPGYHADGPPPSAPGQAQRDARPC